MMKNIAEYKQFFDENPGHPGKLIFDNYEKADDKNDFFKKYELIANEYYSILDDYVVNTLLENPFVSIYNECTNFINFKKDFSRLEALVNIFCRYSELSSDAFFELCDHNEMKIEHNQVDNVMDKLLICNLCFDIILIPAHGSLNKLKFLFNVVEYFSEDIQGLIISQFKEFQVTLEYIELEEDHKKKENLIKIFLEQVKAFVELLIETGNILHCFEEVYEDEDFITYLNEVKKYEQIIEKILPSVVSPVWEKLLITSLKTLGMLLGIVIGAALGLTAGAAVGGGLGSVVPLLGNVSGALASGSMGAVVGAIKGAGIGVAVATAAGAFLGGASSAYYSNQLTKERGLFKQASSLKKMSKKLSAIVESRKPRRD